MTTARNATSLPSNSSPRVSGVQRNEFTAWLQRPVKVSFGAVISKALESSARSGGRLHTSFNSAGRPGGKDKALHNRNHGSLWTSVALVVFQRGVKFGRKGAGYIFEDHAKSRHE